jgi:hypothetical protein
METRRNEMETAARCVGKCKGCGSKATATVDELLSNQGTSLFVAPSKRLGGYVRCSCGQLAQVKRIRARLVPEITCGKRCTEATGSDCDCSCAGQNHGAA